DRIEVLSETDLGVILHVMDQVKPILVIVDSIQTVYSPELSSIPGTVSQVKFCAQELNDRIKERGLCLLLIGHVTKEGVIAGPKVIEHLVDTVLYFDQSGTDIRILRASKNRFGSTDEIGIFQMTAAGLNPVRDPTLLFLEHREGDLPSGVTISPVYEGSRILLVEIQSLVVPAKGGISRIFSERIDARRVSRIAAVLEKHLKIPFSELDIYVNVAGGIRIDEVAIDLALACSLYSAKTGLALPASTAVVGEVSLAGEIRGVSHIERRLKSTQEMGFRRLIGPSRKEDGASPLYHEAGSLQDAIRTAFGGGPRSP
ncbi:MAG TPA: magnesium chelatase domain-containing protein, partial [Spirochaetia bacterium]|nr:magnesium chelatase domain-containing protein [Spirochaetia bacterium]